MCSFMVRKSVRSKIGVDRLKVVIRVRARSSSESISHVFPWYFLSCKHEWGRIKMLDPTDRRDVFG